MIPFNKPYLTGKEINYITDAHQRGQLSGDGYYTQQCNSKLASLLGSPKVLLTHSCTAALEMSALLINIQPGDEVIMPSFTFVSTANAFALRGAHIRFVDINIEDKCLDLDLLERLITSKTKAIVAVHYAGASTDMDRLVAIARSNGIFLVEDAAQALGSSYNNKALGTYGDLACFSFHETKNIISGEGGALAINNPSFLVRAEHIREKGTNRSSFVRGEVDKYSWVDIGSSYLPGELISAFLYAQLENIDAINTDRLNSFNLYQKYLQELASPDTFSLPSFRPLCTHNAHMFYILLASSHIKNRFISHMKSSGVLCVSHYVPLHSSPFGSTLPSGYKDHLPTTDRVSSCLVRLPLWCGLAPETIQYIVESISKFYE